MGVRQYQSKTRETLYRFIHQRTSLAACIAALDRALADYVPRMLNDDMPELRALMLANNEKVMKEMERRGPG